MATQITTNSPTASTTMASTDIDQLERPEPLEQNAPRSAALQSWASLGLDPDGFESERPSAPVPAFVRLSRLIEPDLEPVIDLQAEDEAAVIDLRGPVGDQQGTGSLGRPLFQIGLAALVAATAIGVYTFAPLPSQTLSSVDPTTGVSIPASESESAPADPGQSGPISSESADDLRLELFSPFQNTAPGADLAIAGTATSDGQNIRWTATVRNQGPNVASQPVRVIQTLPADLKFVSAAGSDWDCMFNAAANTVRCDLRQELGVGQRRQLGVVTTDGDATAGTKLAATMAIIGRNSDADLSNNTINLVAVVAEGSGGQSSSARSTGSAAETNDDGSPTATEGNTQAENTQAENAADQSQDRSVEELPKTGAGLTVFLAATGLSLCLAGRRLLQASHEHGPIAVEARLQ